MITAWRVVSWKWASTAFDGEGAKRYGGRWNPKGTPMTYLAGSLSLAVLELLVHLESEAALAQFACIPARFEPGWVEVLQPLPPGWDAEPAGEPSRAAGAAWAESERTPLLEVPSVVIPEEPNYLLNPRHNAAARVEIGEPRPFRIDPRLVRS